MMKRLALLAACAAGVGLAAGPSALAEETPAGPEAATALSSGDARQAVLEHLKKATGKTYRVRSIRRHDEYYIVNVYDTYGYPKGKYKVNVHTGEVSRY